MASRGPIVVVGAGPAGMTAAIAASRAGARVVVCEQLSRPGRKLLATGGGRCNLTNTGSEADFVAAFGRQGRFILPALRAFGPEALRRFLRDLSVPTRVADGFHVFPVSNRAGDVLNALLGECGRLGVDVRTGARVSGVRIADGMVSGVETKGGVLAASAVVLATGGMSYPELGGTGGGYALAEQAGHRIVTPTPAAVALKTAEAWPGQCAGIVIEDARVRIALPRQRGAERRGALLFTREGVSGPAALDISGAVSELLLKRESVPLRISLAPEMSAEDWARRFAAWRQDKGGKHVANLVSERLPRRLADALCQLAGDAGGVKLAELDSARRDALARLLAETPVTITATAGFAAAIVTRGGVALKDVNPETLESRLAAGLFFAGEALDLDGPCGGYNLQWAFSSGWLAGASAARGAR
ncbi:MAG TPA: NAD(P)/FAD-dependent oxidoreductase [Candidatus Brocadiia bacterium]|nr:NAD(P)/FAD-dependent oxidoreductase [Candidatus Brocadiia bacterium]